MKSFVLAEPGDGLNGNSLTFHNTPKCGPQVIRNNTHPTLSPMTSMGWLQLSFALSAFAIPFVKNELSSRNF